MNNNFFKHIKSQSINMSSALETVKKEAFNGKIDFLMKLSKDTHFNNDFSKLASSAAIILAEKGYTNELRQLDKLQPISNETRIECMKASLRTGHPDTAIFIKSLVFNSKDKNKDSNSINARKNEKNKNLSIQEQKKMLMNKIKTPDANINHFTEPSDVKIVIHEDVESDKSKGIHLQSEKKHERKPEHTKDNVSSINGRNVVISSGIINGKIIQNGIEREAGDVKDKDGAVIHVSKFDTLEGFSFFGRGSQSKPSFDDFIKNVVKEYDREQNDNDSLETNGSLVNHRTIDHGITMSDGVIIDSDKGNR